VRTSVRECARSVRAVCDFLVDSPPKTRVTAHSRAQVNRVCAGVNVLFALKFSTETRTAHSKHRFFKGNAEKYTYIRKEAFPCALCATATAEPPQ